MSLPVQRVISQIGFNIQSKTTIPPTDISSTPPSPHLLFLVIHCLSFVLGQPELSIMSFDIGKLQTQLPGWVPFAHPPNYRYVQSPTQMIDFTKLSLWVSVGAIFFNPIFWNFVARNGGSSLYAILPLICLARNGLVWSSGRWENESRANEVQNTETNR